MAEIVSHESSLYKAGIEFIKEFYGLEKFAKKIARRGQLDFGYKTKEEILDLLNMNLEFLEEDTQDILKRLFQDKGIDKFALISIVGEGYYSPAGEESVSGEVLTSDGKIFSFWLEWDENKIDHQGFKGDYTLGENFIDSEGNASSFFREVSLEEYERYKEHPDYLEACKELGLG